MSAQAVEVHQDGFGASMRTEGDSERSERIGAGGKARTGDTHPGHVVHEQRRHVDEQDVQDGLAVRYHLQ